MDSVIGNDPIGVTFEKNRTKATRLFESLFNTKVAERLDRNDRTIRSARKSLAAILAYLSVVDADFPK
jgi:hypothetical protein